MDIDIPRLAKLANLKLKTEEINKLKTQLESVLNYVKKLQEVDTEGIEPTSQITDLQNVTKEDNAKPSLSQEEILSNAKSKHNGFFKVKGIFEGE